MGVQVMKPEALWLIPPGQPWEIHKVYVRLLNSGKRIGGYLEDGYWKDLGTLRNYRRIHVDTLDGRSAIRIPGSERQPGVWVGDGVTRGRGVKIIPPVFLGSNSRVERGAQMGPYTVAGAHCVIGAGAQVARSILWEGVRIQDGSVVEDLLMSRDFQHPFPRTDAVRGRNGDPRFP
jgi:mannose-1-phosphate guanylyltransferase/phosphomannomutase